jgi:hypothetical protein
MATPAQNGRSRATISALAEGSWINDRESIILIGGTRGSAKRCSVIALAAGESLQAVALGQAQAVAPARTSKTPQRRAVREPAISVYHKYD